MIHDEKTIEKKTEIKMPSDTPEDIFGSNNEITPLTNPPIRITAYSRIKKTWM
jgi:hypothetical protein